MTFPVRHSGGIVIVASSYMAAMETCGIRSCYCWQKKIGEFELYTSLLSGHIQINATKLIRWQPKHATLVSPWKQTPAIKSEWTLFHFLCTVDEDLCWPVPSGALHGLHHRSIYGVPSPRLPQALPRDVALHLWDRVEKGTYTHTQLPKQLRVRLLLMIMQLDRYSCEFCPQELQTYNISTPNIIFQMSGFK